LPRRSIILVASILFFLKEGVELIEQKNSIEVAVQEDGSYLVNGISLASSSEAELPICSNKKQGQTWRYVIAADANATHQSVVRNGHCG
jgi:biopolymer transport protein ExbD